jgi:hypothetical protein
MGKMINLKTCFALPGSGSGMLALPEGVETVRDLLGDMGGQIGFNFIDLKTGELEEDLEIIINGKEVWFYPSALDINLNDGDIVEIYLLPLGGG